MDDEIELDLVGVVCPYTFVHTKLALESMVPGEILSVRFDHQPATRTLPDSVRYDGQEVLSLDDLPDGGWRLRIRKLTDDG